jgi:hypothetical protein
MSENAPFLFRWGDEMGVRAWARAVDGTATVALHHGADDRWLQLDAPERFADWAAIVADRLPACRSWITSVGLNQWPLERYVGVRTLATGRMLRAFDHQLAGHVLAEVVLQERRPGSTVVAGIVPDERAYELAALLSDVEAAPGLGVPRPHVGPFLRERKQRWEAAHPARTPRQRLIRRLAASAVPLEQALPRALGASYEAAARTRAA